MYRWRRACASSVLSACAYFSKACSFCDFPTSKRFLSEQNTSLWLPCLQTNDLEGSENSMKVRSVTCPSFLYQNSSLNHNSFRTALDPHISWPGAGRGACQDECAVRESLTGSPVCSTTVVEDEGTTGLPRWMNSALNSSNALPGTDSNHELDKILKYRNLLILQSH